MKIAFGFLPALFAIVAFLPVPTLALDSNAVSTADEFVTSGSADPNAGLPTANYGGAGSLMISPASAAKGEMQSLLKFNLAATKSTFDSTFGIGNWVITGIK